MLKFYIPDTAWCFWLFFFYIFFFVNLKQGDTGILSTHLCTDVLVVLDP